MFDCLYVTHISVSDSAISLYFKIDDGRERESVEQLTCLINSGWSLLMPNSDSTFGFVPRTSVKLEKSGFRITKDKKEGESDDRRDCSEDDVRKTLLENAVWSRRTDSEYRGVARLILSRPSHTLETSEIEDTNLFFQLADHYANPTQYNYSGQAIRVTDNRERR